MSANKYLFIFVLIFVFSNFVVAQEEEIDKAEIFAGYSGATLFTGDDFEPIENGFNVSAVYNVHRYVGVKVDASGTYRNVNGNFLSTSFASLPSARYQAVHSLYNVTAGVQFKDNSRDAKVKPFAHVLAGYGKHFDEFKNACPSGAICPPFNVDFEGVSLVFGGGVDYKINRRIAVRIIQFDLNPIIHKTAGGDRNVWMNNRFSSGIVFNF